VSALPSWKLSDAVGIRCNSRAARPGILGSNPEAHRTAERVRQDAAGRIGKPQNYVATRLRDEKAFNINDVEVIGGRPEGLNDDARVSRRNTENHVC
jgi:hypothetical protein